MGLLDDAFDFVENVDFSEDHLWGHGFDARACYGDFNGGSECPHLESGKIDTCGCCGCPITNLDLSGAPPESCPDDRLAIHGGD